MAKRSKVCQRCWVLKSVRQFSPGQHWCDECVLTPLSVSMAIRGYTGRQLTIPDVTIDNG